LFLRDFSKQLHMDSKAKARRKQKEIQLSFVYSGGHTFALAVSLVSICTLFLPSIARPALLARGKRRPVNRTGAFLCKLQPHRQRLPEQLDGFCHEGARVYDNRMSSLTDFASSLVKFFLRRLARTFFGLVSQPKVSD
jgi:hypothetical protein